MAGVPVVVEGDRLMGIQLSLMATKTVCMYADEGRGWKLNN